MTLGQRSAVWWRRLWVMTGKELLQLSRDTALVLFVVYGFTLDIYFAGEGISLALNNAALFVLDEDRSAASRELIGRFQPPYFDRKGEVGSLAEGTERIDRGQALALLAVPPQLQRDLLRGQPAEVLTQVDTSNSVIGFLASAYAAEIIARYGAEWALRRTGARPAGKQPVPRIENRQRTWYNPNQTDAWFMSISELLTIVTVLALILPAAALVREKERGTIEQLLVSPLSPFQVMFPKVVAMTAVILFGTAFSTVVIVRGLFHVPPHGSLALFLAVTALYVFTASGLGMLIATLTRNLAQAGLMVFLLLSPMLLLSGAWTPPEAMPGWLRAMMVFSPLFYYVEAGFGILLRGAGLALIWDSLLGMAALGAAIFALGMWRFRRQFR